MPLRKALRHGLKHLHRSVNNRSVPLRFSGIYSSQLGILSTGPDLLLNTASCYLPLLAACYLEVHNLTCLHSCSGTDTSRDKSMLPTSWLIRGQIAKRALLHCTAQILLPILALSSKFSAHMKINKYAQANFKR